MKRKVIVGLFAALPFTVCVQVVQAQSYSAGAGIDASRMQESGPAVAGGNGMTVGPNSKNQAVMPMPGLPQYEELAERPRTDTLPLTDVRPVTRPATTPAPAKKR
ncbi:hypothetical protein BH11PSE3_BH11PSE3_13840 [soil metagenome]